ncbi:hypothetical protein MASR1M45_25730 [Candidatus Kapaibacterium sp.]
MPNKKKIIALTKFLTIYIGIIILYYVFISFDNNPILEIYINITSKISALILSIFDSSIIADKQLISGSKFSVILSFGCEGSEPVAIFFAGVMSYPSVIKYKLQGLVIGLPALYLLNIIRIILLYFIGVNFNTLFDFAHTTLFPIIFILIALAFWMLWINRSNIKF